MGHAFTFCTFDVLVRFVEASGVRVRYVQNITDVDDPLFERARRDGIDWRDLVAQEVAVHIRDMDALGWRRPDVMPRVSEEIEPILRAATRLHSRRFAYQSDALYFDVSRYPRYGQLSHRTRLSMIRKLKEEALLGTVGPGAKRDALDFPLWRSSAPGGPGRRSRVGGGRRGWRSEWPGPGGGGPPGGRRACVFFGRVSGQGGCGGEGVFPGADKGGVPPPFTSGERLHLGKGEGWDPKGVCRRGGGGSGPSSPPRSRTTSTRR